MWGELSSEWGELSSECGASCLGASFLLGELSWDELSLWRVVRNPTKIQVQTFLIFIRSSILPHRFHTAPN